MRDRSTASAALRPAVTARPVIRKAVLSIDVVLVTTRDRELIVLLSRADDARARERWELPWDAARTDEPLEAAGARVAHTALGSAPAWLLQVGALGNEQRHPADATFSVAYLGVVAHGTPVPVGDDTAWFPIDDLPQLAPRQRVMVDRAIEILRVQIDQAPVAFRLLPPAFTLSELQEVYEVLLGRKLHKASFRRALHAAWLVEPIDEWRSEGRGRPAQLFRFAPKRRRGARRGVRFELLAG